MQLQEVTSVLLKFSHHKMNIQEEFNCKSLKELKDKKLKLDRDIYTIQNILKSRPFDPNLDNWRFQLMKRQSEIWRIQQFLAKYA